MAAELKPYRAYKDSGVGWLGDVPEHWVVRRIKTLFREREARSGDGTGLLLSLTRARGLVPQSEASNRIAGADDLTNYKACRPGDLVMNRMQAWSGMFAVSPLAGLVSPDYSVFEAIEPCETEHFAHLFRTSVTVDQFAKASKGIGSGFNRLYTPDFGAVPIVIPPLPEQVAIVRFLDHADRHIRRYIRAKQKMISLLEEQKHAIIRQAVTGQIDVRTGRLYPTYKRSGVEWLGQVPAHWNELALKRWVSTRITDGPHETPIFRSAGVPFLSAEAMVEGRLDFDRRRGLISQEQHEIYCKKCHPRHDDIFMCKSGATTGKVAIVQTNEEFSVWSPLALIRVDSERVLPELLFNVLQSRYVQRQVQDTWSYGTQPNLSMGAMERLLIVLPPIDEQRRILTRLELVSDGHTSTILHASVQINLLQEFRTRLIADVVTGKLDVRAAAAGLPEVDPLPADDDLIDGAGHDTGSERTRWRHGEAEGRAVADVPVAERRRRGHRVG